MEFLLVPLIYMMIGTIIARRDYANRSSLSITRSHEENAAAIRGQMRKMSHGTNCYLGANYKYKYDGSGGRTCDCSKSHSHAKLVSRLAAAEAGAAGNIDGPYAMLFGWPFIGYHKFLVSGNAGVERKENARVELEAAIDRAEKELGIGSLK